VAEAGVAEAGGLAIDKNAAASRPVVYVMTHPPAPGYAGHVGDEVILTAETALSVYVRFASGILECFPPLQFAALFSRRDR
jgi:hypothetical protein